jgi:GT2 family glycosyltransferase
MVLTPTRTRRPADTRTKGARLHPGQNGKVLVVVVTHNGRRWLKDCLVALNAQTYWNLEVLVVDDHSETPPGDSPLARVVKRHLRRPSHRVLSAPKPLGFGGAANWALSRHQSDAEFLLFLHDDACVDDAAIARMVARLRADERIGVVGPKVVSWDDPGRLEEVGLSIDRLGYPYGGLEQGERDSGQHDFPRRVFHVTSTCVLVRHNVFRALRGWDAGMRAFGEDLDFCWRAHLAGHGVAVEPHARARHAGAMVTGMRKSPFVPERYYARRNRLRALGKNAGAHRLVYLMPQFILVSLFEMVGFFVMRQPRSSWQVARALAWNALTLPAVAFQRGRAQRLRRVPDKSLRPLTVPMSLRLRSLFVVGSDRLEQAWARRADIAGLPTRSAGVQIPAFRSASVAAAAATVVLVLVALRHFLWAPPVAVGELLPYPEGAGALWRAYLSPWSPSGLGNAGPSPPALGMLGVASVVALGSAALAQKVLVLGLGAAAGFGAYRLVNEAVGPPGRLAAAVGYVAGPLGYVALRTGDLPVLVFGAAAPVALRSLLTLVSGEGPPGMGRGPAAARLALAAAVSAAFVPGSLVLYAAAATVAGVCHSLMSGGRARPHRSARHAGLRGLAAALVAIALGWALLVPWSLTWWRPDGPIAQLTGDSSWRAVAATWRSFDATSVLTGRVPGGPILGGFALLAGGLVSAVVCLGARRRMVLSLWAIVALSGVLAAAVRAGLARPLVESPLEASVLPSLCFAGLLGLAVGGARADLSVRRLGLVHALTSAGLVAAVVMAGAGMGPALLEGTWAPGSGSRAASAETVAQIGSILEAESLRSGPFRVLWVGDHWPSGPEEVDGHALSGSRGPTLGDLFGRESPWESDLAEAVTAIEAGTADRAGELLGAFNVRYVVLDPSAPPRWLSQLDLAVVREEPDFMLLENTEAVDRAAIYERVPPAASAVTDLAGVASPFPPEAPVVRALRPSPSRYTADSVAGPGIAWLAESADEGWGARLGRRALSRVDGGWGNAFRLPAEESGDLTFAFSRPRSDLWGLRLAAFLWLAVAGVALARPEGLSGKGARENGGTGR